MKMPRPRSSLAIAISAILLSAAATAAGEAPAPSLGPAPSEAPSASEVPAPAESAEIDTTEPSAPIGPINWTRSTRGQGLAGGTAAGLAVAEDGTAYLCGSTADQLGGLTAAVWSSADATKWAPVRLRAKLGSICFGIVAGPNGLVAVGGGDAGHLWTSSNGRRWRDRPIEDSTSLNDIKLDAAGLLVAGDAGADPETAPTLWTSVDGAEWQAHPIGEAGSARHVAVSPDGVIVVAGKAGGEDGPPVTWRSTDAITWQESSLPGIAAGPASLPALEHTPLGFVLSLVAPGADGSREGSAWVSADGSAWLKALVVPEGSLSAVASVGPEAMLVGPGGTWRSSDGTTWVFTAEDTFEPYDLLGGIIALADGGWLAAGDTIDPPEPGIATWVGSAPE
jgi:hypothetical protein